MFLIFHEIFNLEENFKNQNVKSGNFQFSQNVLNFSKSYVLNIS